MLLHLLFECWLSSSTFYLLKPLSWQRKLSARMGTCSIMRWVDVTRWPCVGSVMCHLNASQAEGIMTVKNRWRCNGETYSTQPALGMCLFPTPALLFVRLCITPLTWSRRERPQSAVALKSLKMDFYVIFFSFYREDQKYLRWQAVHHSRVGAVQLSLKFHHL